MRMRPISAGVPLSQMSMESATMSAVTSSAGSRCSCTTTARRIHSAEIATQST